MENIVKVAYKHFKIESQSCRNELAVVEYAGEQVRENCLILSEQSNGII